MNADADRAAATAPPTDNVAAAVFFDRDNTLIVNDGYLGDPAAVRLMPGAAAAVAAVRRAGYAVVVVSNQSGVARGLFDEPAVRAVDRRLAELLAEDDPAAVIDLHLYCPHHPQAAVPRYRTDCDCRKPRPGLLRTAAARLRLDLSHCWLVGDAARDVQAGRAAGCRTVRFVPPGIAPSPDAAGDAAADATVTSLADAVGFILAQR